MRYLLDTNVLIDWFTAGPSAEYLAQLLNEPGAEFWTAWICLAEFLVKSTTKEAKQIQGLITQQALTVMDVSGVAAATAVAAMRRATGLKMPDCLVLAAAQQAQATLLTRDAVLAKHTHQLRIAGRLLK